MDEVPGRGFTEQVDTEVTDFRKFDIVPAFNGGASQASQDNAIGAHEKCLEGYVVFVHEKLPVACLK
jgi:hypothetical protein